MKKWDITASKIVNVECDVCHKSCKSAIGNNDYAELHVPGGWGYGFRKDTEYHECDMCEDCYDKVKAFIESLGGRVSITSIVEGRCGDNNG